MLLLEAHRLRQAFGQSKDQCHDMLGNYRTVNFAGVGEDHIAIDQLRKHELMNRRSRRMNPAQVGCSLELFRTQRPGNDDFGGAKAIFDPVVTRSLNRFDAGKIANQPLGQPRGRVPKLERMAEDNQQFHDPKRVQVTD
jgi:hypothetical protein